MRGTQATHEAFGRHLLTSGCSPETVRTYINIVGLFGQWCIRQDLNPLKAPREAVQRYLAEELPRVARNTVALRLAVLRAFYAFLDGHDGRTHGLRVKPTKLAPRVPLTEAGLRALLGACRNPRDRAMVTVAARLGLRVSEAVAMQDADVDLEHGILLVHGKGARERQMPLDDELVMMLRPYLGHGPLWWMRGGRPMTVKRAQRNMEEISKRAGVRVHWHKLRTTFANRFLEATHDLDALQTLMGHSDANTTRRYAAFGAQQRAFAQMRSMRELAFVRELAAG